MNGDPSILALEKYRQAIENATCEFLATNPSQKTLMAAQAIMADVACASVDLGNLKRVNLQHKNHDHPGYVAPAPYNAFPLDPNLEYQDDFQNMCLPIESILSKTVLVEEQSHSRITSSPKNIENHPLSYTMTQPILPDHVLEAEKDKPYDPFWMTVFGVPDKHIEGWRSKKNVEDLFRRGALTVGDQLHFKVITTENEVVERAVFVRHLSLLQQKSSRLLVAPANSISLAQVVGIEMVKGMALLRVEILQPGPAYPDGVTASCSGVHSINELVLGHFHDRRTVKGVSYDSVYVRRGDQELGSLYEVRQRYALWEIIRDNWAARTNKRVRSRRLNKKTGNYYTLPVVHNHGKKSSPS
ncbi:MAG: hypothetical protein Q9201_007939 [Fulgogasparrea decipioides]